MPMNLLFQDNLNAYLKIWLYHHIRTYFLLLLNTCKAIAYNAKTFTDAEYSSNHKILALFFKIHIEN